MAQLPVYKAIINPDLSDDTGVDTISLVTDPAIGVNFMVFGSEDAPAKVSGLPVKSSDVVRSHFKLSQGEYKRILITPILIPDIPIYRNDNGDEYVIEFGKSAIKMIKEKYEALGNHNNFNFQHINGTVVKARLTESLICSDKGFMHALGFDLPAGTWVGTIDVEDEAFFDQEILSGNVKGVSVEAMLSMLDFQKKIDSSEFMSASTDFELERASVENELWFKLNQLTDLKRTQTPNDRLLISVLKELATTWVRQLKGKQFKNKIAKENALKYAAKIKAAVKAENWDELVAMRKTIDTFFED